MQTFSARVNLPVIRYASESHSFNGMSLKFSSLECTIRLRPMAVETRAINFEVTNCE